ncbi:MAG TPA: hypothetical protein PLC42_01915 [Parachlamydiaceae bacterium]|nr:hypothetical protein [Parachlamydiaceae bacterium]
MTHIPLIMILSPQGDSLYLKVNGENFRDVKESDSIHPALKRVSLLNNRPATLYFLQKLSADKEFKATQNLKTYHYSTVDKDHTESDFQIDGGTLHECSLFQMTTFIFNKLSEEAFMHNPAKL